MSLFVPVSDPEEIRRELLTNSKSVLDALRRYEHFREIRKAKLEAFHQLASTWTELEKLQRKLKTALPKTDVRPAPTPKFIPPHQKPAAKPEPPKPPIQKPKPHEHKTKVQLLEEQLAKIEGRLQNLK